MPRALRTFSFLLRVCAACLFFFLGFSAADAQNQLSSRLEESGFKMGIGPEFPLGRQALELPTLLYVFHPAQPGVAANLDRLAALSGERRATLDVRAMTAAGLNEVERRLLKAAQLLPIETGSKAASAYPAGSQPVYVLLERSGSVIGVRIGFFDWSTNAAHSLLEALASGTEPGNNPELQSTKPNYLAERETAVIAELNRARSEPAAYASLLREYRARIRGNLLDQGAGAPQVRLEEGAAAVDEAIAFLERQRPLGSLTPSAGLSAAARLLALDQEKTGAVGHRSADGSSPGDRIRRFGIVTGTSGENCAYGNEGARDIVIQLIVDDGVSSRGHRANIFNERFRVVGVAIAPHPVYRWSCVMDFADAFSEAPDRSRQ